MDYVFCVCKSYFRIPSKQLNRSWPYYLSVSVMLIFSIASFFSFYGYNDPYVLVYRTRYTQIVFSFLSTLIGTTIGDLTNISQFKELETSFSNHPCLRGFSHILLIIWKITLCFLLYIAVFSIFLLRSVEPQMIKTIFECYRYMILYIYIPGCTLGIMSYVISYHFDTYGKYGIIALLWLFFSPMICLAGRYLFSFLQISDGAAYYAVHILNQGDMIFLDNPSTYSLHTEMPRFAVRMMFLGASVLIAFVMELAAKKTKIFKSLIMTSFAVCVILAVILSSNQETNRYFTKYICNSVAYTSSEDADFYIETRSEDVAQLDASGLTLLECNVVIKLHPMSASFTVTNIYDTAFSNNECVFTLYRGFTVDRLTVNGYDTPFERAGDYITLVPGKNNDKMQNLEICFYYHGLSSAAFPATEDLVFLPSFYPYLPQIGRIEHTVNDEMGYGGYETLLLYNAAPNGNDVSYRLTVNTEKPIITNLSSIEDDHIFGTSDRGLTIIVSDVLEKSFIDGTELYLPEMLIGRDNDILTLYKDFRTMRADFINFTDTVDLFEVESGKTIIMPPTSPGVTGISLFYTVTPFSMIYQGTYAETYMILDHYRSASDSGNGLKDEFVFGLVKNWLNEQVPVCSALSSDAINGYILYLIEDYCEHMLVDKCDDDYEILKFNDFYLSSYYTYIQTEGIDIDSHIDTANRIECLFERNDNIEIRRFIKNWFELCSQDGAVTLDELKTII